MKQAENVERTEENQVFFQNFSPKMWSEQLTR
jgi:hypothetical protein